MRRVLRLTLISVWILLISTACVPFVTPSPVTVLGGTPPAQQINAVCDACDQATLVVALTQAKNNADNQAAATAEILRANAQETLNSANATLSVAQTQDQDTANVIAAQIAATAEFERANAQATLNSAGITQSFALTQDSIRQTQMADVATTGAESILNQQIKDEIAAGTQTAIANVIATQTQVAVATSQWYADRDRQRDEQRQGPIAFLWMWCFPVFSLLLTGLIIWGFWRWLQIQQANQRILEIPVERLPAQVIEVVHHQHDDSPPRIESDMINAYFQPAKPDDQVQGWIEEVKQRLLSRDKEDEDDHSNH